MKHRYAVTNIDIWIKLFPKLFRTIFGSETYEHVWYLLKIENAAIISNIGLTLNDEMIQVLCF